MLLLAEIPVRNSEDKRRGLSCLDLSFTYPQAGRSNPLWPHLCFNIPESTSEQNREDLC